MKLDKINIEPKDVVPDIIFFGETSFDTEQLKNVEDVKNIALEAILKLGAVRSETKDRAEYSISSIHKAADKAIADIEECLRDFE